MAVLGYEFFCCFKPQYLEIDVSYLLYGWYIYGCVLLSFTMCY